MWDLIYSLCQPKEQKYSAPDWREAHSTNWSPWTHPWSTCAFDLWLTGFETLVWAMMPPHKKGAEACLMFVDMSKGYRTLMSRSSTWYIPGVQPPGVRRKLRYSTASSSHASWGAGRPSSVRRHSTVRGETQVAFGRTMEEIASLLPLD